MSDLTITCRDCAITFAFTEGEQAFFSERGYTAPSRCPNCRRNRRAFTAPSTTSNFTPENHRVIPMVPENPRVIPMSSEPAPAWAPKGQRKSWDGGDSAREAPPKDFTRKRRNRRWTEEDEDDYA